MERQDLQQQASDLQSALDAINQRLSKLEHKTSQE
jgi:predicted  nucleic acid-binding Zn-ribbon protein